MSARRCTAMDHALRLLAEGATPAEAASLAGVSRSGLHAARMRLGIESLPRGRPADGSVAERAHHQASIAAALAAEQATIS